MSSERSIQLHGRPLPTLPTNLPRSVAAILLGLLTAVALLVVARRFAGVLANPLEPVTLLATGVLVAAVAAAIRLGWFSWPASSAHLLDRAVMLLTSLCLAALGVSLCVPETPIVGKFLLCTLLGAEESWAWAWRLRRRIPLPFPHSASLVPTPHRRLPVDPDVAILSEDITQQLTRSHAANGAEELSGWLRMSFVPGQRTGSLHVAFCPPFAATPELEVEQLDGPEARIKTAQLLPHGARLDLKLAAAADEPTSVLLQFSARTVQAEK